MLKKTKPDATTKKTKLCWLAMTSLLASLSGCSTYSLDQSSVSEYEAIAPQTLTVPFKPVYQSELAKDLRLQPEGPGLPQVSVGSPEDDHPRNTLYDLDGNGSLSLGGDWNGPMVLLGVLTLGVIPPTQTFAYSHSTAFTWNGKTLTTLETDFRVREAVGMILPTPFLVPGAKTDVGIALGEGYQATMPAQNAELARILDRERNFIRQNVDMNDPDSVSRYLSQRDNNLMTPGMTQQLARLAPADAPFPHHRKYLPKHDHYVSMLTPEDVAWLIGPEGLSGYEIKQALDSGQTAENIIGRMSEQWMKYRNARYRNLSDEHRDILMAAGLPVSIVNRMNTSDPDYARVERREAEIEKRRQERLVRQKAAKEKARQVAEKRRSDAKSRLDRLVISNNSGQYLSPYTSDGVTAEWVNQAINANIGATAGSAVGAAAGTYAANKALESVPFGSLLGGVVGSEVGESVGREVAIQASGGWDHIRRTSDMSFRSLSDMASYLKAVYGTEPNFDDVLAATAQVYPEFADKL